MIKARQNMFIYKIVDTYRAINIAVVMGKIL